MRTPKKPAGAVAAKPAARPMALTTSTSGEIEDRAVFHQVMEWLTKGKPESAVRESLAVLPADRVEQILQRAVAHYQAVGSIGDEGLRATLGWCLEASKQCYQELMDSDDYLSALKAIKQIKDLASAAAMMPPLPASEGAKDGQEKAGE